MADGFDAFIVRSRTKITRKVLEKAGRLRVIGRAGSGLDNIDLEAAKQRGIAVVNTPEAVADSVAELTIALIFAVLRRITVADRSMKEDMWLKRDLTGHLLKDKTLGAVGVGRVGSRVRRIAEAIGMKVIFSRSTSSDSNRDHVSLEALLKRSDVVTLHVPLTSETYHMIGREQLLQMKDGAFLINTSRGSIVDEEALLHALKTGKLAGAALDVYETEPPKNRELVKLPNVICTPHIGSQTEETQRRVSIEIAQKICEAFPSS